MACVTSAAMKTPFARVLVLATAIVLGTTTTWAADSSAEELAVWQAMAGQITRDNASKPYKQLYFMSDFESAGMVSSSMSDPTRKDYCGLSQPDAQALVSQLKTLSAEPVELDASIAEQNDLKLGHRKHPRLHYVALSRGVFDPSGQRAWLAVDLSATSGSIMRLDKVGGQWNWTSRCGGWLKPLD